MARIKRAAGATWRHFSSDQVGDLAAMLTYYAIFALFPFALFVVSLTLLVLPDAVLRDGIEMLGRAAPQQVAGMVREHASRLVDATRGGFAAFGLLLSLWGASRGVVALGRALNRMHQVRETRPWWRIQVMALGVTLASSVLILIALGLLFVGPWAGHLVADRLGVGRQFDAVWGPARWIGAAFLVMLVWAILLYFTPNLARPFRWVTPGAVIAVVVWLGASRLFALYVGHVGSYERTYGALGAVIVALTWLWITNFTLLLGGEIDDALDDLRREREGRPKETKEKQTVERHHDRHLVERGEQAVGRIEGPPGELARRISEDLTGLAKDHIELAKVELGRGVKVVVADGVAALLGGVVALIGFALLCATAVVALAPLIPALWLRMLIMSFVYLVAGGVVAAGFVKKMKGDVPPDMKHTRFEARMTAHALKDQVQHG